MTTDSMEKVTNKQAQKPRPFYINLQQTHFNSVPTIANSILTINNCSKKYFNFFNDIIHYAIFFEIF